MCTDDRGFMGVTTAYANLAMQGVKLRGALATGIKMLAELLRPGIFKA